jgi:DNA-binding PadR family transcriptional regulator
MERKLLLLGLLRSEEMHGYQLNEFIDSHLGETVYLKKPTAYRLLNQMADDGWVSFRVEQAGNRPPRRVYALTERGEAAFRRMLRESLAGFEPVVFPGNIALLFLDALHSDEAVELLQLRRAGVESELEKVRSPEESGHGHAWLLLHQIRHLETELEWLDEVITKFESGSQVHGHHAGEGEK